MDTEILLGNDAIALALVEHNCRMVTGYPGTPSSEILAGVVKYKKQLGRQVYTEWSTNEKVAMEVALAAAWSGLRAAVTMKQVGLNVASDPLFSATYSGVKGGFVIIVADDPGPQSSQTEQDSRIMALNAKVPVFDPSSPAEARDMIGHAMQLSEKYGIPVILRPTTRICHAVQSMTVSDKTITDDNIPPVKFRKDPQRWAATPRYRYTLHVELNRKLQDIETDFAKSSLNYVADPDDNAKIGIIASGVAFHTARQTLVDLGIQAPILKIGTPFPLPQKLVTQFTQKFKTVVVLEESDTCIELQLPQRGNVRGRLDGTVPSAGELTPEVVFDILADIFTTANHAVSLSPDYTALQTLVESIPMPVRRPRLCPGCSHRSVYFSLKREFGPKAIYPGDIGCYTLGTNLRMVDTVVDMGASISMAHGFYQTNRLVKDKRPIIATIGDSTFFHSGVTSLINAVHAGGRFVLLILDNHTTAMTGFQPTAESEFLADGSNGARKASIADIVRGCGVQFVRQADPYNNEAFQDIVRSAYEHTQSEDGGVAVVIADRPCVLYDPKPVQAHPIPVLITEDCDGCRYCTEAFECPALVLRPDNSRVDIDEKICIDCGQCIDACYKGFIVPQLPVISVQ